jgi:hypothetical protein
MGVTDLDLGFLIHYISKYPDDVDWEWPISSWDCMLAAADEYTLEDLKSEIERRQAHLTMKSAWNT